MTLNSVNNALAYIQGVPFVEKSTSIISDSVDAVKQVPSFTIFEMVPKIYSSAKYGINSTGVNGIKGVGKVFSDFTGLLNASDGTIELSKGLKNAGFNYDAVSTIYKANSLKGVSGAVGKNASALSELAQSALKTGDKNLLGQVYEQVETLSGVAKKSIKVAKKTKQLTRAGKAVEEGSKLAKKTDEVLKTLDGVSDGVKGLKNASKAAAKAGEVVAEGASGGILKKLGGAFKKSGAGVMLAIDGALELFTNVIPAFQAGGVESGVKQVGKSALKVGASTAGWVGGAQVGQVIGATVGSIFPGAGTLIGGMLGNFVGGLIGSSVASHFAEKITGKSEVEKIQEEAVEQQAVAVAQNTDAIAELNQAVYAKVQEDIANNNITEETKEMMNFLNSGGVLGTNASYNATVPEGTAATQNALQSVPQADSSGTAQTESKTQKEQLDELVAKVNSGDLSVYDVPDAAFEVINEQSSKIAQLSGQSGSTSYANSYTAAGYTNPYASSDTSNSIFGTNQKMNFYGV